MDLPFGDPKTEKYQTWQQKIHYTQTFLNENKINTPQ